MPADHVNPAPQLSRKAIPLVVRQVPLVAVPNAPCRVFSQSLQLREAPPMCAIVFARLGAGTVVVNDLLRP